MRFGASTFRRREYGFAAKPARLTEVSGFVNEMKGDYEFHPCILCVMIGSPLSKRTTTADQPVPLCACVCACVQRRRTGGHSVPAVLRLVTAKMHAHTEQASVTL
jgi:hypothetical protein